MRGVLIDDHDPVRRLRDDIGFVQLTRATPSGCCASSSAGCSTRADRAGASEPREAAHGDARRFGHAARVGPNRAKRRPRAPDGSEVPRERAANSRGRAMGCCGKRRFERAHDQSAHKGRRRGSALPFLPDARSRRRNRRRNRRTGRARGKRSARKEIRVGAAGQHPEEDGRAPASVSRNRNCKFATRRGLGGQSLQSPRCEPFARRHLREWRSSANSRPMMRARRFSLPPKRSPSPG